MNLREMEAADIQTVSELEDRCFTQPWSEQMIYEDFVANRRARFYVADDSGQVIGYIGIWKVTDNIHITTIAVDPDARRRGVATNLVRHVIEQQAEVGRPVTLEVRLSNRAARRLYESLGFVVTGRRKNYYSDNHEDAIIMDYRPSEHRAIRHGHSRSG